MGCFNNGIAVNATPFQQMTVVCSKGDDGIVCTTTDAVKYLKGLMEGKSAPIPKFMFFWEQTLVGLLIVNFLQKQGR